MHNRTFAAALALLAFASFPVFAQAPAGAAPSKFTTVLGTVTKIGDGAKTFGVKPDKGDETTVMVDPRTKFLRIPAGETDIKKATDVQAGDVGVGDRVLVRVQTENPTGLPAGTFVITKQADVTARNAKTQQEWQTQSVTGNVKSVDAAAKQVVIVSRVGQAPPRDVTLDMAGNVDYTHYNSDTGADEPGTFALIKVGDDVRLIGDRNADQTQIKTRAIRVITGTIRSVPVQIKSIDIAAQTIEATDLATKKAIVIGIRADTLLKKLDDATALAMARRLNPSFQAAGAGRGGRGGQGGGDAAPQQTASIAAPGNGAGQGGGRGFGGGAGRGGPGGGGRGGRGGAANDPNRVLEGQPSIELNDLKAGDPVVITGTMSSDNTKLMAMSLVAGVEPILRAAPANGPDPLGGNWNFGGVAAPE